MLDWLFKKRARGLTAEQLAEDLQNGAHEACGLSLARVALLFIDEPGIFVSYEDEASLKLVTPSSEVLLTARDAKAGPGQAEASDLVVTSGVPSLVRKRFPFNPRTENAINAFASCGALYCAGSGELRVGSRIRIGRWSEAAGAAVKEAALEAPKALFTGFVASLTGRGSADASEPAWNAGDFRRWASDWAAALKEPSVTDSGLEGKLSGPGGAGTRLTLRASRHAALGPGLAIELQLPARQPSEALAWQAALDLNRLAMDAAAPFTQAGAWYSPGGSALVFRRFIPSRLKPLLGDLDGLPEEAARRALWAEEALRR